MHVIQGDSFFDVYKKSISEIIEKGDIVAPRGSLTYELSPATLVINNPRKFLCIPPLRKGNYTFQLAEMLWMIRGSNDLEEIAHYNKAWNYFEDDDCKGILNGAYGERLRAWNGKIDQFYEVYKKLKNDKFSRQAVMIIFDPDRDNEIHIDGKYSKDIPCTNYFVFTIRNNKLNMMTVMRSNDLSKGTLYDIPTFIIFQHILAGWLEIEVGKYTHVANSFHIYEEDVEKFIDIYDNMKKDDVYKDGINYGDPRLTLNQFNDIMPRIIYIEETSRKLDAESLEKKFDELIVIIQNYINNSWWKSVAAQILSYNLRKKHLDELSKKASWFVTNEYKDYVNSWRPINVKN